MSYEFMVKLPKHLEEAYRAGNVIVTGGVARDVGTKVILGHLESVSQITSINPYLGFLNLGLQVAKFGIKAYEVVEVKKVLRVAQTIQSLSCINLALSGTSLGVGLAGFYLVCNKLNHLDNKLTEIDKKILTIIEFEQRKLLAKTNLIVKNTRTMLNLINQNKSSFDIELKINELLNQLEEHIGLLLDLHQFKNDINLPFNHIQVSYVAYVNLLKSYFTFMFLNKDVLVFQKERLDTLKVINTKLQSSHILKFIYLQCIDNHQKILTSKEVNIIMDCYKFSCQDLLAQVENSYEILSTIPRDNYLKWQNKLANAYNPLIFIEH
jgi:hypothetical protein